MMYIRLISILALSQSGLNFCPESDFLFWGDKRVVFVLLLRSIIKWRYLEHEVKKLLERIIIDEKGWMEEEESNRPPELIIELDHPEQDDRSVHRPIAPKCSSPKTQYYARCVCRRSATCNMPKCKTTYHQWDSSTSH
jgi:hypothetical protein